MSKSNEKQAQAVRSIIEEVRANLDKAVFAIKRGDDPFGSVDEAWAVLNDLHYKMDEGKIVVNRKTNKEIEKVANELYYSDGVNLSDPCREAYDEAHNLYPDANDGGTDTDDAQEYIVDRLISSMESDKKHGGTKGWNENDLQRLQDELGEMVHAGLT